MDKDAMKPVKIEVDWRLATSNGGAEGQQGNTVGALGSVAQYPRDIWDTRSHSSFINLTILNAATEEMPL